MSFLNAALLGGMAAAGIPVVIHLLHRHRFEKVRWGAMHLLERVLRENQRRLKLQQLLLLLVRMAIPLLLALAMARPVWQAGRSLLGGGKTSTVVLLDNSYSMEAGRTGATAFGLAKEEAVRLLGALPRGSDMQVVLMGQGGGTLFERPSFDAGYTAEALRGLDAGYGTATVPAALEFASGVMGQMHEASRQVVVFTDFQRVSFTAPEAPALSRALERLRSGEQPAEVVFFDVGQDVHDNLAVEALEYSRLMVGVGQKLAFKAHVRNFGDTPRSDLPVYFRVDGEEKAAAQVTLGAHQSGQVNFNHTFSTAGSHVVEVSITGDSLAADNVWMASIPVRDRLPVLLVNGEPSAQPLRGETDFAEIGLQPFSAGRVAQADLLGTRVIPAEQLDAKRLSECAVVVLANVARLTEVQVRALEGFVSDGGGLMIWPGSRVDVAWYRKVLFNGGAGLLPQAYDAVQGDTKEGGRTVALAAQRFEHPALDFFNDPRNGSLAEGAVRLWMSFAENPAEAAPSRTIARLETGAPFLVEKAFGTGRVVAACTALDADWGNLPMRPFYVPLLQRLTVDLASGVETERNLEVGQRLVALLPAGAAEKKVRIGTPGGGSLELTAQRRGGRAMVEYGGTQRPGLYTVEAPDGGKTHFVVNAARRESDLQRLASREIERFGGENHVAVVRDGTQYQDLERQRRFGRELWQPILVAVLVLLLGELWLQQRFTRPAMAAKKPVEGRSR